MPRTQFHVVPHEGGWQIEQDGQPSGRYDTQQQALDAARGLARAAQPSQILLHGENGRIQDEYTYGDDPYPPRG
jgi:hypothetical protein